MQTNRADQQEHVAGPVTSTNVLSDGNILTSLSSAPEALAMPTFMALHKQIDDGHAEDALPKDSMPSVVNELLDGQENQENVSSTSDETRSLKG